MIRMHLARHITCEEPSDAARDAALHRCALELAGEEGMAHEARWDEEGGFLDVVFEGELSAAERVSLDFAVNNIEVRRLIEASTAEELGELEPVRLRLKGGGLNMAGPAGPENVHPTIALAPDPERLRVFVGLYGGDRAREAYVFRVSYPHPVYLVGDGGGLEELPLESDEDLARWADGRFGPGGWEVRDLS